MPQLWFIHRYFKGEWRMVNRMTGELQDMHELARRTIELNGVTGWSYEITDSAADPRQTEVNVELLAIGVREAGARWVMATELSGNDLIVELVDLMSQVEWEDQRSAPELDRCHHCGKEYEDFSDIGCEFCDTRHPGYGVL